MRIVTLLRAIVHAIGSSVASMIRAHPPSRSTRSAIGEHGQAEAVSIAVGIGLLIAGALVAVLVLIAL